MDEYDVGLIHTAVYIQPPDSSDRNQQIPAAGMTGARVQHLPLSQFKLMTGWQRPPHIKQLPAVRDKCLEAALIMRHCTPLVYLVYYLTVISLFEMHYVLNYVEASSATSNHKNNQICMEWIKLKWLWLGPLHFPPSQPPAFKKNP